MKTRALIDEFLKVKRFAMVGASRDKDHFSRRLLRELLNRGYDVVPINPFVTELEGKRCFARVKEITPPISCAILMTSRQVTDRLLRECADAGITLVWIYGISGPKRISRSALDICAQYGLGVIAGYCPFMFLERGAFFHKLHGAAAKLIGQYPK